MITRQLLLPVALGCLWAHTLPGQAAYTIVDLGAVPGGSGAGTTAVDMNAMGDCVGWSTVGSAPHASWCGWATRILVGRRKRGRGKG